MGRKARSDSVLKGLSEERQEQLIEWINEPKTETCVGGFKFARDQLAADGINLKGGWLRQLSEFRDWWDLQQDFRVADSFATQIEEVLKVQFPEATPEKLSAAGQLAFTAMATAKKDAPSFIELEKLRLQKESDQLNGKLEIAKLELKQRAEERSSKSLELAIQKFQWEATEAAIKHAREIKSIISDKSLSQQEIMDAVRLKLFGPKALEKPPQAA